MSDAMAGLEEVMRCGCVFVIVAAITIGTGCGFLVYFLMSH
jgi:hypothetical protein